MANNLTYGVAGNLVLNYAGTNLVSMAHPPPHAHGSFDNSTVTGTATSGSSWIRCTASSSAGCEIDCYWYGIYDTNASVKFTVSKYSSGGSANGVAHLTLHVSGASGYVAQEYIRTNTTDNHSFAVPYYRYYFQLSLYLSGTVTTGDWVQIDWTTL